MPILNFNRCLCGELEFLSKNNYCSSAKASKIWEHLFNTYIKEHGLPESYTSYIEKMKKALAHYEKAYSGKKWEIVKARIYEAEAMQFLTGETEDIKLTCAKISKFLGFPVRANEVSVNDFYSYIKLMSNG